MASPVWSRNPTEAYLYRFDFDAQDRFVREASAILDRFSGLLRFHHLKFGVDERSVEKAVWMLQMDALGALRDSLDALVARKHRVAAALFRTVEDTLAIAAYFHSSSTMSKADLESWYDGEIVTHKKYREWLRRQEGSDSADSKKQDYRTLSKFTHRSYQALLDGCEVGPEKKLAHVDHITSRPLIPVRTLSVYFYVLAELVQRFSEELSERGVVRSADVDLSWREVLEND